MRNIERIEGRNIWLDLLKGITIILVIIGHILSGANGKSILHNHYLAKSIDDAIGVFHMPMFFLLSGIAFSYIKNRKNKIVENSINILLLYVIWSCVMYLLKELFPQIINVAYDDSLIVCLLYKPISPYWYFLVLFEYYIMHVLFDKIHIKYLELVFAVVISGLAPVFWSIGPDKTSSYIFRALFHFVFFYYGILFVDLYKNERLKELV